MISLEEATSYVKWIIALMIIAQVFRVTDILVNWVFLSTHPDYVFFFRLDLAFIGAGVLMILFSWVKVSLGVASGIIYPIFGMALTIIDPDLFHFITEPQRFIVMDFAVSILFIFGTPVLLILFILGIRAFQSSKLSEEIKIEAN